MVHLILASLALQTRLGRDDAFWVVPASSLPLEERGTSRTEHLRAGGTPVAPLALFQLFGSPVQKHG